MTIKKQAARNDVEIDALVLSMHTEPDFVFNQSWVSGRFVKYENRFVSRRLAKIPLINLHSAAVYCDKLNRKVPKIVNAFQPQQKC